MINFTPVPYIPIGSFNLSTHGLLIAAGFLVAVILARREAGRRGLSADLVDNAAIVAVIAGLVGARLVWILMFGRDLNWLQMLEIWRGGLSAHGGYVFGIVAGLAFVKYKKIDVLKFADAVLPFMFIGWAIGRLGCFLNWDSFGTITTVSWAVTVGGEARHATQLYESLGYLLVFFIFHKKARSRLFVKWGAGVEAAFALIGFALVRFVVDFWRDDPLSYLLFSRIISIAVIGGCATWIVIQYDKYAARRSQQER